MLQDLEQEVPVSEKGDRHQRDSGSKALEQQVPVPIFSPYFWYESIGGLIVHQYY
jgi:hypothetical protein